MSIFRPINSDESNLFTIRCCIKLKNDLTTVNNNLLDGEYLLSPTKNNLPDGFQIIYMGSEIIKVKCGSKRFTSRPSINLTPYDDLKISNISLKEVSNFSDGFIFEFEVNNIVDKIFDLIITGPIMLGLTTGNSNKGWNLTTKGDIVYSYLPIGVGTAEVDEDNKVQILGNMLVNGSLNNRLKVIIYTGETITSKDSGSIIISSDDITIDPESMEDGTWFIVKNNNAADDINIGDFNISAGGTKLVFYNGKILYHLN